MTAAALSRILFILYCIEAGAFLLIVPWTPAWDRTLLHLPFDSLRLAALHPLGRGLVCAFGLLHLVWGAHDLELWLSRRRSGGGTTA